MDPPDSPDELTPEASIHGMICGVRPPGFIRPSIDSRIEEEPTSEAWEDNDPDVPRRYSFDVDLHGLGYKILVDHIKADPDWRFVRQYVRQYRANKDHVRRFMVEEII